MQLHCIRNGAYEPIDYQIFMICMDFLGIAIKWAKQ